MIKISHISKPNYNITASTPTHPKSATPESQPTDLNAMPHYKNISFSGQEPLRDVEYIKAKTYLSHKRTELEAEQKHIYIGRFNLKNLEGIQKGITIFKGLNLKELALISQKNHGILVSRACPNGCAHCYNDAQPRKKETENHINAMSFEDLKSLTDGYDELNKRLGFSIFTPFIPTIKTYIPPFYDADCMDITVKDKHGKEHDLIEINNMLQKITERPTLIDTCGWNTKSEKTSQRAKKYVEYYSNPENNKKLYGFNLSLNPFHKMNARYVEYIKSDPVRAKKFRELYTDRMAQVLFDLTPISKTKKFSIYALSTEDKSLNTEGYRKSDLKKLYGEIRAKLEIKYKEDLNKEKPEFVHNKEEIAQNLERYDKKSELIYDSLQATGRMKNIYDPSDIMVRVTENYRKEKLENKEMMLHDDGFSFLIDANGKVYFTNEKDTFPTEMSFNFENKNKATNPLGPNLHNDYVITKEKVKKHIL